jgi:hypothetical protein
MENPKERAYMIDLAVDGRTKWIHIPQDKVQVLSLMNTVMNLISV